MSAQREAPVRRLAAPDIAARKGGEPLVCLTAYTAPVAAILDDHCDLLLVGDSPGHGAARPAQHRRRDAGDDDPARPGGDARLSAGHGGGRHAVRLLRGRARATAYANAVRVMKETGAQAVKVESGPTVPDTIRYLTQRGIPVMGHVGLQTAGRAHRGRLQGEAAATPQEWARVLVEEADADAEAAGAFSLVIEGVAEPLARAITERADACPPSASAHRRAATDKFSSPTTCLVSSTGRRSSCVAMAACAPAHRRGRASSYAADVRARSFPAAAETYFSQARPRPDAATRPELLKRLFARRFKRRVAGAGDAVYRLPVLSGAPASRAPPSPAGASRFP